MSRFRRLMLALAVGVLGLLIGTGTAWAYFSTTGHGSGTVHAARLSVEVLPASGRPDGPGLLPGGTGGALLRLHNQQPVPITLTAVRQAGPAVASNGCPAVTVHFRDRSGLAVVVAPGATREISLAGVVSLAADADPSCQGAGFAIPVTVTVRS